MILQLEQEHDIWFFTWLTFVNWSKSTEEEEYDLMVPLSCQFFLVHYSAQTTYKLVEIYKVENLTFFHDYGFWNDNNTYKLITTNLSWYQRRMNLKNLTITLTGYYYFTEDIVSMHIRTYNLMAT